jgi:elongation factor Ts
MIKVLREATGAGVLDCKKALEGSGGDIDLAAAYLREKGLAAAAKKASRQAREGLVSLHVDAQARRGVIVEVNCETDFVARTEDFQTFSRALLNQIREESAAVDVATLMARPYVLDRSITVADRIGQLVGKLGENIVVRSFDRVQGDGLTEGYTHPGNRIGVLIHASAGSRDVAESAAFRELVHDLALQVAAAAPKFVAPSDIPADQLEAQRATYVSQVADEKKPEHIKERIITGKLEKWYEAVCLLRQSFIKDDSVRIADLIGQKSKQWGAPLSVERFVRYELGADE